MNAARKSEMKDLIFFFLYVSSKLFAPNNIASESISGCVQ